MVLLKEILNIFLIIYCSNGFRIDVKRKSHVEINGTKIDENGIHDLLEEHEILFLFGKSNTRPNVKFAHVIRTDKGSNEDHIHQRRKKRSLQNEQKVSLLLEGENGEEVDLKLHQTPNLIDDAFILIRRYENSSQFISDSHKLAMDFEKCFYRNENSSLDLCDDTSIRGIFHHNSKDFLIHPLPERFGQHSHIIFEATPLNNLTTTSNDENFTDITTIDNKLFEPELDRFNDLFITASTTPVTSTIPFNITKNKYSRSLPKPETILLYSRVGNKSLSYSKLKIGDDDDINYNNYQNLHSYKNYNHNNNNNYYNKNHRSSTGRVRRHIESSPSGQWKAPQVLHIETAIFVDRDLFKHMARNFPKNTESHLIRFVLAMINGVQLLYHHPSLGHQINFVLKRLEILHSDPKELRRSSDIDIYLNNFCMWQRKLNPSSDADVVHYDHAVILTGLDLYVVGKNNKISSQVVGLAPVSGMCTSTSSCTINEGKHFESVFVVAHEIGHNLGMRHDTNENNCDPSLYIMSPTLGSGKITWSKCSRSYLQAFLEAPQAKCLFDRGQFGNSLDHSAEGILPGERFDADQQCMLKYGKDSIRARRQVLTDICRDLHCQRDRYTWTSHPALEGTECGEMMWCRSGICAIKSNSIIEPYSNVKQTLNARKNADKVSFVDNKKLASLRQYNFDKPAAWGEWSYPTECASGCLYGPSGRLREGSTGLKTHTRNCLDYKKRCMGRYRKYESCIAKQCYTIEKTTISEFATQICERAKKIDTELIGEGIQKVGETGEEACKVYCKTKSNTTKSRSWTFPDGTTCKTSKYNFDDTSYCINGRCEKFSCENTTNNFFKIDKKFCPQREVENDESKSWQDNTSMYNENSRNLKSIRTKPANNNNNAEGYSREDYRDSNSYKTNNFEYETKIRNLPDSSPKSIKRKSDSYQQWKYDTEPEIEPARIRLQIMENEWMVKSGCHFSCMDKAKGVQIVTSKLNNTNNIQLCSPRIKPCDKLQTPHEYAESICGRYRLKVRGLSGYGMQIAPNERDPDRSCRVACQDEFLKHRFYLVNGDYGLFPFGTKCSHTGERYCINGKCLEFGPNEIPLTQSYINLALFRNKRDLNLIKSHHSPHREKRNYIHYMPIIIRENVTQEYIDKIINNLNFEVKNILDESALSNDHIEFNDPIHISMDELIKT